MFVLLHITYKCQTIIKNKIKMSSKKHIWYWSNMGLVEIIFFKQL